MTITLLSESNVEGRPRGGRTVAPSETHFSFDQLFDSRRNGAGLEARGSGKVRSCDWLFRTNYLENNIAIDITCIFTRRQFNVRKIDSPDTAGSVFRAI
jgi:hypothetical protein